MHNKIWNYEKRERFAFYQFLSTIRHKTLTIHSRKVYYIFPIHSLLLFYSILHSRLLTRFFISSSYLFGAFRVLSEFFFPENLHCISSILSTFTWTCSTLNVFLNPNILNSHDDLHLTTFSQVSKTKIRIKLLKFSKWKFHCSLLKSWCTPYSPVLYTNNESFYDIFRILTLWGKV